jgi:hypothetical protein
MATSVVVRTAPGRMRAINHLDQPAINKRASQQHAGVAKREGIRLPP